MKTKITFLLSLFSLFSLFGQVKQNEVSQRDNLGTPKFIKFKETKVSDDLTSIKAFLKKQFDSLSNNEFKRKKAPETKIGFKSEKLQQFYKGIRVEHSVLNVVSKDGNLKSVNGKYLPIKNLKTKPGLKVEKALEYALSQINAEEYAWQNAQKEALIKRLGKSESATYYPQGELVIIEKNKYSENSEPVLAYKFDIYATNPISRKIYYVDANSGDVIFSDAIIKHVQGLAATRYSGQRTIETEQTGSQFRLRDVSRGNSITTYNNFNQGSHTNTHYIDNDNTWSAAEYNNPNGDNASLDAHWGAMMTYDYFSQTHNRNSIDNNGYELINYVNADLTGWGFPNSDNAFWDGSVMTYGMGTILGPLVSLDIIAHEIGHGLDENTSDLVYQRESGAIDEGLSDIWGAMVEFFAAPEKDTYLLAEDIGITIRSMSDPKFRNDPDTYGGDFWINPNCGTPNGGNDFCGVHTNSGILNHWFYLLAEGSSATDEINDNGDTFSITGIGKLDASRIIYRAQTVYFTPNTNYNDARDYTIQAAEDLFGSNSIESITTCQAWFAVGVGNSNCAPNVRLNGDATVCFSGSETYNLTGLPTNAAVSWSVSSRLQILSSNNNSITVKASSSSTSGSATITATYLGTSDVVKSVWVGNGSVDYIEFNNGAGGTGYWCTSHNNNTYKIYPKLSGDTHEFRLRKYPNLNIVYTSPTIYSGNTGTIYYTPSPGWYELEVRRTNDCGTSSWFGYEVEFVNCSTGGGGGEGGEFFISPNPSSYILKIQKKQKNKSLNSQSKSNKGDFSFKFYNFNGVLLKGGVLNDGYELDVSKYPKGRYILKINGNKKSTETHHIIIE
ncbi:M4 family metallopeptidase [Flavivirga abyssicola]|uniref:M4 family metallopeptidase n=1 Tax=Flavivirga abyssicola TaxID=3063533 RepID=UPI0026DFC461|nr:M4 family metallopeptidase [Flavivirga sp. MEBiC07777]WVK14181.1 M4 family metallopeptidase [Flavivirga sp. MEBiC07777]